MCKYIIKNLEPIAVGVIIGMLTYTIIGVVSDLVTKFTRYDHYLGKATNFIVSRLATKFCQVASTTIDDSSVVRVKESTADGSVFCFRRHLFYLTKLVLMSALIRHNEKPPRTARSQ